MVLGDAGDGLVVHVQSVAAVDVHHYEGRIVAQISPRHEANLRPTLQHLSPCQRGLGAAGATPVRGGT